MRRTIGTITLGAIVALVFAVGAPAYADPGDNNGRGQGNPAHAGGNGSNGNGNAGGVSQSPPGFNGTVKIHDGDTEAEPIRRNEPHVGCTFHIHGFNFDANSSGTWNIQSWPPTGDRSVVASGSWGPANGDGDWRTSVMSLPGGDHNQGAHYKLNVDQTSPSAPGGEKHKVFWVDCPPVTGGAEQGEQQQQQQQVAGFEQAAVSPIVESAEQPGAQPAAQAGAEAGPTAVAGLESLPSTSTDR